MAFTSQRGRPRTSRPQIDPGTPELRLKHALGLTTEPIDACLEKQIITPEHHRSALHLRWLYTVRYGAPTLTTRYADTSDNAAIRHDDPEWRASREKEYFQAVTVLKTYGYYESVMRVAIYNETPIFLHAYMFKKHLPSAHFAARLRAIQTELVEGLALLSHHWQRQRKSTDALPPQPISN